MTVTKWCTFIILFTLLILFNFNFNFLTSVINLKNIYLLPAFRETNSNWPVPQINVVVIWLYEKKNKPCEIKIMMNGFNVN